MTAPRRYLQTVWMNLDEQGGWVTYEDYAALERERDEAQSKLNTMKVVLDTVAAERNALRAEVSAAQVLNAKLAAQLAKAADDRDAFRAELEKWQHEARSLQGENDRLRAKHIPAPADRQATDEEIVAYIKHNDHTVLAANVSPGGVVDTNVTTYRMAGHRTDYVVRAGKVVRR